MKIKKPEIVPMFKCSAGPPVETLPLWKRAELDAKLKDAISDDVTREVVVTRLIEDSEDFIAILWLKEKGRPNGAKDSKPRKQRKPRAAAEGEAA